MTTPQGIPWLLVALLAFLLLGWIVQVAPSRRRRPPPKMTRPRITINRTGAPSQPASPWPKPLSPGSGMGTELQSAPATRARDGLGEGATGPGTAPAVSAVPSHTARPRLDWSALADEAARVNVIGLLKERGFTPIRERATSALFRVPWREDRHPSLGVCCKDGLWYWTDFAWKENGTAIQVLEHLDGLTRVEAIRRLTGTEASGPRRSGASAKPVSRHETQPKLADPALDPARWADRKAKMVEARRLYREAVAAMTPAREAAIRAYWERRGVRHHPEHGVVWLDLPVGPGQTAGYLAIPVPTPKRMVGLECRLADPERSSPSLRAKTYGPKELWVWGRDVQTLLVTESVLDALAAEVLWPDRSCSLVALNGIGNVELLRPLVWHWRPRSVVLALDNDAKGQGQAAQQRAQELLGDLNIQVLGERAHHDAGVKDLWRLLHQPR